jgi:hypothetical protein
MALSNLEARNAYQRSYYAKHREHIRSIQNEATSKRSRGKTEKEIERWKSARRYSWKAHGIINFSTEKYEALYAEQNGRCACCGMAINLYGSGRTNTDSCVDHDKNTGEVRGLLCRRCNLGIGFLGDSIDGVLAAERFLTEEYGGLTSGCM